MIFLVVCVALTALAQTPLANTITCSSGTACKKGTIPVFASAGGAATVDSSIVSQTGTSLKVAGNETVTTNIFNSGLAVAADKKTNHIYVSNQSDDTISVIGGATNRVLATLKVSRDPNGIAVNSKTNTIYVANLTSRTLSIIDGTSLRVSSLWVGSSPAKVAVDSLTSRVFVTLEDGNGFLDVIDAKSVKIIAAIPVPPYPLGVAVDSGAHRSYVADFLCGCGQISVVDNKTNKVVNTIHLRGASLVVGVALDQKDNFVYATDENTGFYVIDRTSGKVLGHISDHSYPNEVTAIPGTTLAVEPDTGSDRAVFVDALSFAVKKRVRVGKSPTGVAVNAATKRVYVVNKLSNTVSVIQLPDHW